MTPYQDTDTRWQAVLDRDESANGVFVYAVQTTGIYCRPTCPSRRPYRRNVTFFDDPQAAEQAGFRPCRRCQPDQAAPDEPLADLMVAICRYLEEPHERIPTLAELGQRFGLSPYHLQRTFKRLVGVSPWQYADAQRQQRLKDQLKSTGTVTTALYEAGYGTASTLYTQSDDTLGMSPIHYRNGGPMTTIDYTITPCALGHLLVAATERGVCRVSLGDNPQALQDELAAEFPQATLTPDSAPLSEWVASLVAYLEGEQTVLDLPLDIQATSFQRKVWEALRTIPYGSTRSYGDVAQLIGQPTAARAVAQACASNPVAVVIPCHRIVRQDGGLSGYRWGVQRKRALLALEQTIAQQD